VNAQSIKLRILTIVVAAASLTAGCGEVSRQGRTPAQLVIMALQAASGATPAEFGGTLMSDVQTIVQRTVAGETVDVPTIFNDFGQVELRLQLRDPGIPGVVATPSTLNEITITRYRVEYRRTDGRNTPGVDVPFPIESAVTFTVSASASGTSSFEIVRHTAKGEAPLRALVTNGVTIATIADVTFWGRDQAGNEVSITGHIGINFGNFGDPS
jgi:hypothetical protein